MASRSAAPPTDLELFSRLRRAGVGLRHAEFVMGQFCDPAARDTAHPWWADVQATKVRLGTGMLDAILGPRGRGKTMLATMLLGAACWRDDEPVYVTAMDLSRDVRREFDDRKDRRRKYERTGLLVIDEIHRGDSTDYATRLLEAIVDHRYARRLDTVLVGNERPERFAQSVGDSTMSRIKEAGRITVMDGEDFRERKERKGAIDGDR